MNVLRPPAAERPRAELGEEQKSWQLMPLEAPYEIKTGMRTFYYPGGRETKSRINRALAARLRNARPESGR